METIDNYEFGKTYDEKIPVEDADKFATIFGEKSPTLTKLIKYCIVNNIVTHACCKGHPENRNVFDRVMEKGYITFRFDMNYEDDDFAYFLATIPSRNKKIVAYLESNYMSDRTITFYVPARTKGESEKYFEYLLDELIKYKQMKDSNKDIYINPETKKLVDYIFYRWRDGESFEITQSNYRKYERQGMYIKRIATCPTSNKTGKLHAKFGIYLQKLKNKNRNIDDFINYSHSKR